MDGVNKLRCMTSIHNNPRMKCLLLKNHCTIVSSYSDHQIGVLSTDIKHTIHGFEKGIDSIKGWEAIVCINCDCNTFFVFTVVILEGWGYDMWFHLGKDGNGEGVSNCKTFYSRCGLDTVIENWYSEKRENLWLNGLRIELLYFLSNALRVS